MTLKKCPSCGHQHDSEDMLCPYCKHSYSNNKVICSNCGAYLKQTDKLCYVCGQIVEKTSAPNPPEVEETEQAVETEEKEDTAEYIEDKQQPEEKAEKPKKSSTKKLGIVCVILVLLVGLVSAGVCYFYSYGMLPLSPQEEGSITLYFEKPLSNQNLLTTDGTVYNWTGDVQINYVVNEKVYNKACILTEKYDNIWRGEIPANATKVYFSEKSLQLVRTEILPEVKNEYIYFLKDIIFNNEAQLVLDYCRLSDFSRLDKNTTQLQAPETTVATESETVAETEQAVEETTAETEPYSIYIPEQWSQVVVIENENCTSYYESYNYSNYQCGNLFSVYVYDANDTSYSEMNVEKVITSADGTKKIVVVTPTDIQFNDSDDTAIENYTSLSQYTTQVIDSIKAN